MEERRFKTNAKCGGCVNAIAEKLNPAVGTDAWNIDLASADRVLTVRCSLPDEELIALVQSAGFKIERL